MFGEDLVALGDERRTDPYCCGHCKNYSKNARLTKIDPNPNWDTRGGAGVFAGAVGLTAS